MMNTNHDTITAIATPAGTSALAIIRMSGPESLSIIREIFTPTNEQELVHRSASLGFISDSPEQGTVIDQVIVTPWFAPHSYTGQDVVEISCHGGQYIVQHLIQLLLDKGARLAGPGEFSIRAYLNGKMDLVQAEAIVDVIHAGTQSALRASQGELFGKLSGQFNDLKTVIAKQLALLEIELDFSEEDVEFSNRDELLNSLQQVQSRIDQLVESFHYGHIIRNGAHLVIAGPPNVGKSSLLNRLLDQERAIVSDIPGTTRDTLEESLNINGYLFRITDTAGLRETEDTIERLGVERTHKLLQQADVVLHVVDATQPTTAHEHIQFNQDHQKHLFILNKIDLIDDWQKVVAKLQATDKLVLPISAKTGEGFPDLLQAIVDCVFGEKPVEYNNLVTKARHRDALIKAREHIHHAQSSIQQNLSSEFIALDIRSALNYIGEITGQVTTDDILNDIFSKFCIGK